MHPAARRSVTFPARASATEKPMARRSARPASRASETLKPAYLSGGIPAFFVPIYRYFDHR